jgi:predicted transposase YdaD
MGPHDGRFKLFFSFRRMMADLIRGFVRGSWLDGLDLETLEPAPASVVSRGLRQKHGDCLWRAHFTGPDGASTWLYLWVEFQSQPDRQMPVRLLSYGSLLLEHVILRNQLALGGTLPLIIALVVKSGRGWWNTPLELRELFPPVPDELAQLLPSLSYLLIEPARMSAEALDQPDNLAAAFFRITEAQAPEELLSLAGPLSRMLAGKEEAELRKAFIDLLVETFRTAFPEVTIPHIRGLEELSMLEENMIRWRKSVLSEGRRKGRAEGRKEGREKGREEGRGEGRVEGRKEGRVEGMQRLLLKQMKLRFGSLPLPVRRQIREISSMTELEKLAGRLLTASSLSDLGLE